MAIGAGTPQRLRRQSASWQFRRLQLRSCPFRRTEVMKACWRRLIRLQAGAKVELLKLFIQPARSFE